MRPADSGPEKAARAGSCPHCGAEASSPDGAGDGVRCPGCKEAYWFRAGDAGWAVRPEEGKRPSAPAVALLHAGVLLAELVLAPLGLVLLVPSLVVCLPLSLARGR